MKIRFKKLLKKGQRRKPGVEVEKNDKRDKNGDDWSQWTSKTSLNMAEEEERSDADRLDDDASQPRVDAEDALPLNFKKFVMETIVTAVKNQVFFITTEQKEELMSKINQDFFEILQDKAMAGEHTVDVHLGAAKHVLEEFIAVQDIIRQTTMPSTTQDIIYDAMEECLLPRITYHYLPMSSLAPEDAAKIAMWINDFLDSLNIACPGLEPNESWSQDRDNLIERFMENAIRKDMNELLNRTLYLQSESDVREGPEGHLVTGLPETIASMFQQQLNAAREQLPSKYQEEVQAICNQELSKCVPDMQLKITTEWKEMGCAYLCALVNDTYQLYNQCQERNDNVLQSDALEKEGRQLVRDLTELSLHATRFLSERIMEDLREPEMFLTSVGDKDWECNESPAPTARAIVAFKKSFANVETWLISSDYYFPKVLKACLDQTVQTYLDSFFANTMLSGVQDPAAVSEELRDDYLRLSIFFNGATCEDYHGSGGFYTPTEINNRLTVLHNVAGLVDPSLSLEDSKGVIKALLLCLESREDQGNDDKGDNNKSLRSLLESRRREKSNAVLHLIGLRKRHGPLESIAWFRMVSSAQKELDADDSNRDDNQEFPVATYKVPDLRHSKYLFKRPT